MGWRSQFVMRRTPGEMSEDTTKLQRNWSQSDPASLEPLFALVYEALRKVAAKRVNANGKHTLEPTALLREALVRLLGRDIHCQDRAQFLALAALKMPAALLDHARARASAKCGGDATLLPLSQTEHEGDAVEYGVLAETAPQPALVAAAAMLSRLQEVRRALRMPVGAGAKDLSTTLIGTRAVYR